MHIHPKLFNIPKLSNYPTLALAYHKITGVGVV